MQLHLRLMCSQSTESRIWCWNRAFGWQQNWLKKGFKVVRWQLEFVRITNRAPPIFQFGCAKEPALSYTPANCGECAACPCCGCQLALKRKTGRNRVEILAHHPSRVAHTRLSGVIKAWSRWYALLVKPGRSGHKKHSTRQSSAAGAFHPSIEAGAMRTRKTVRHDSTRYFRSSENRRF